MIDKIINYRFSSADNSGRIKYFHELKLKSYYETIYKFAFRAEGISLNLETLKII